MTRGLSASMLTAVSESVVRPVYLLDLAFASGANAHHFYLSSRHKDVTWNSLSWLGNGWFQEWDSVSDDDESGIGGLSVVLTGVPEELTSIVLNGPSQKAQSSLWLGLLDGSDAIIVDPIQIFSGFLDTCELLDAGDESAIRVTFESEAIILDRECNLRYTEQSQAALFPHTLDRAFRHVESIANGFSGYWGVPEPIKKQKKTKRTNKKRRKR